jgi:hypothetical protein
MKEQDVISVSEFNTMINEIKSLSYLKKSEKLVEALVKDYAEFTKSETICVEGFTPNGSTPSGSYYIRTKMYKCYYHTFIKFEHAERIQESLSLSVVNSIRLDDKNKVYPIKTINQELGILKTLQILHKHGCKFEHTKNAYIEIKRYNSYGLF